MRMSIVPANSYDIQATQTEQESECNSQWYDAQFVLLC